MAAENGIGKMGNRRNGTGSNRNGKSGAVDKNGKGENGKRGTVGKNSKG